MHKGSQGEWGFSHHYQAIWLPSGLTDASADLAIINILLPLRYLQGVTVMELGFMMELGGCIFLYAYTHPI